jgi:hypothetical protein
MLLSKPVPYVTNTAQEENEDAQPPAPRRRIRDVLGGHWPGGLYVACLRRAGDKHTTSYPADLRTSGSRVSSPAGEPLMHKVEIRTLSIAHRSED